MQEEYLVYSEQWKIKYDNRIILESTKQDVLIKNVTLCPCIVTAALYATALYAAASLL